MTADSKTAAVGNMIAGPHVLPMLVIFDKPSDFPEHAVIRRTDVEGTAIRIWKDEVLFSSIREAREWVRASFPHLHRMARHPLHDPESLVETWL